MSVLDYEGLDYHTGKFKTWVNNKLNSMQIKTYTSIESLGLSGTPTVNEIKLAMPLYSELLIEVNLLASKTDSEGNTLDNASCRIVKLNSDGRAWAEAHGKSDGKHYVMRLGKNGASNDFTEVWEQISMNSDNNKLLSLMTNNTSYVDNFSGNENADNAPMGIRKGQRIQGYPKLFGEWVLYKTYYYDAEHQYGWQSAYDMISSRIAYRYRRNGSWFDWVYITDDALGLKYIYNVGKSDYGISSTGGTSTNNSSVASDYFRLNAKDGGKTGMVQFTQPFDFRKSSRLLYNVSYYNSGTLNQVRVYLGTSAGKNDLMSFDIPLTTGINGFSLPDSVKTRTETYITFVCYIVNGNTGDIRFDQVYVDNLYQDYFDKSNKTEDFYFMKYYDYLQDPSKDLFVKSTSVNDKIESNGRGFTRTTDEPALLIKIRYDNASTGNYWTGFGILSKTKYGCITGTPGNAYSNINTTDIAVETTPNGNTVYVSHMASAWTNNNYPCTITTTNGTTKSISEPVYYLGTTTNKNKLNKFILAVADYLLFDSNDILPISNSFSKNNLSTDSITTSQLTVTDISHYVNDKSLYFKTGNGEAGFINYTTSNSTIYSSGNTTKTGVVGFHVGNSAYNTRLEGDYLYLYGGTMLSANTTLRTGSDEKVKAFTNDIESDNDNLIKLFDIINPKTYKYRYLTNDKLNIGFSAQEVESAFLELGIKPEKYNILNISYNHMLNRGSNEEDCKYYTKFMSIAYSDLHNLAILKIKDMEERHTERLNSLENKLEMLEDKLGGMS